MLATFNSWFTEWALWFSDSALWVLFFTGFFSATLLPGGSEASLIATLSLDHYSLSSVLFVATLGNTLGGMTNYLLGLLLPNRTHSEKYGHKAITWLSRYGYWGLLLSWAPIIGDALCLAAGWLRMAWLPSLLLIAIGKAVRYAVLAAIYFQIM